MTGLKEIYKHRISRFPSSRLRFAHDGGSSKWAVSFYSGKRWSVGSKGMIIINMSLFLDSRESTNAYTDIFLELCQFSLQGFRGQGEMGNTLEKNNPENI